MQGSDSPLRHARWTDIDLTTGLHEHRAQLVTCAYVLNEIQAKDLPHALRNLWDATEQMLLILEPGTP